MVVHVEICLQGKTLNLKNYLSKSNAKYCLRIGDVLLILLLLGVGVFQWLQNNSLVGLFSLEVLVLFAMPYMARKWLVFIVLVFHTARVASVYFGYEHISTISSVFVKNFLSLSLVQYFIFSFIILIFIFFGLVLSSKFACKILLKVNLVKSFAVIFLLPAILVLIESFSLVSVNIVGNTVSYFYNERHVNSSASIVGVYDESGLKSLMAERNQKNFVSLIVVESLGYIKNELAMSYLLSLLNSTGRVLEHGQKNQMSSGTLGGEIRELCGVLLSSQDIRSLDGFDFSNCLPYYFKRAGYSTAVYHGGPHGIYDRPYFYKKVGFDQYYSGDQFQAAKRCEGGWSNAPCDLELLDEISKGFDPNKKTFVYFLSINSHHPYTKSNPNFDFCGRFRITGDLECKYFEFVSDLFSRISKDFASTNALLYITGDHSAPGLSSDFMVRNSLPYFIVDF